MKFIVVAIAMPVMPLAAGADTERRGGGHRVVQEFHAAFNSQDFNRAAEYPGHPIADAPMS
jgi:hypothetical protein